jgi:CubicO group peptidase (beta-lactamase class C family)
MAFHRIHFLANETPSSKSLNHFILGKLFGQNFNKVKMDSLFTLIDESDRGMFSVAIYQDGEPVYDRAIGHADLEAGIKADTETRYRIGSISKTFTAVLILQLVEQGKLSLDSKLSDFYPKVENANKITIEHLLQHRSGVFNFTDDPEYTSWMEEPISKKKLLKHIEKLKSDFEPGKQFSYSNSGYVLLSFILEEVSGKSYGELLQQNICLPCALESTYFGGKIDPNNKEAYSYAFTKAWEKDTETDMSVPLGAGALVSTPNELNRFFNCLFSSKLLKAETFEQMTKQVEGYGMGIFEFPLYKTKAQGHTGGIDGFASNAAYFPKEKVSVAMITNGSMLPLNDLLVGVLSIYFDKKYELPVFRKAVTIADEELDAFLGTYSSPSFPLKIKIRKREGLLFGQATGQPEFPLEYIGENRFQFLQAGLELKFDPETEKMTLKQGGGNYVLKKE